MISVSFQGKPSWNVKSRHPGMWSQVGLRKHHYEQSQWRWWNSSWAISNPKRWCCECAALYMPANWKTQQWPQDWKRSVFFPIPKKGNAKECSNYHTIALISHTSKVMLKILQARLQQYVKCELPDVQDEFRKGRGTRDQIANIRGIIDKAREFQKNIYFCFINYAKAFDGVKKWSESHSVMSNSLRPHGLISHGSLQARLLEWVAFPFSRASSQSRSPAL